MSEVPLNWRIGRSGTESCWALRALPFGEISRGEKMALRGTDPESYITEYTLVYEDNQSITNPRKFDVHACNFGKKGSKLFHECGLRISVAREFIDYKTSMITH